MIWLFMLRVLLFVLCVLSWVLSIWLVLFLMCWFICVWCVMDCCIIVYLMRLFFWCCVMFMNCIMLMIVGILSLLFFMMSLLRNGRIGVCWCVKSIGLILGLVWWMFIGFGRNLMVVSVVWLLFWWVEWVLICDFDSLLCLCFIVCVCM